MTQVVWPQTIPSHSVYNIHQYCVHLFNIQFRLTSELISTPAFLSSSITRFAPSLNFGFAASLIICIVDGGFPGVISTSILDQTHRRVFVRIAFPQDTVFPNSLDSFRRTAKSFRAFRASGLSAIFRIKGDVCSWAKMDSGSSAACRCGVWENPLWQLSKFRCRL